MPIRPENKSRYPKDWKLRSCFIRFYRARNRCEWCDCWNGLTHPQTGSKVVLTTAHTHDHRPEAAQLLNLAALCQRCHNRHDMKHRARQRKRRKDESASKTPMTHKVFAFGWNEPAQSETIRTFHG
jgi:5-methylcytosine-specific restriction endonuclease McrA